MSHLWRQVDTKEDFHYNDESDDKLDRGYCAEVWIHADDAAISKQVKYFRPAQVDEEFPLHYSNDAQLLKDLDDCIESERLVTGFVVVCRATSISYGWLEATTRDRSRSPRREVY